MQRFIEAFRRQSKPIEPQRYDITPPANPDELTSIIQESLRDSSRFDQSTFINFLDNMVSLAGGIGLYYGKQSMIENAEIASSQIDDYVNIERYKGNWGGALATVSIERTRPELTTLSLPLVLEEKIKVSSKDSVGNTTIKRSLISEDDTPISTQSVTGKMIDLFDSADLGTKSITDPAEFHAVASSIYTIYESVHSSSNSTS